MQLEGYFLCKIVNIRWQQFTFGVDVSGLLRSLGRLIYFVAMDADETDPGMPTTQPADGLFPIFRQRCNGTLTSTEEGVAQHWE